MQPRRNAYIGRRLQADDARKLREGTVADNSTPVPHAGEGHFQR